MSVFSRLSASTKALSSTVSSNLVAARCCSLAFRSRQAFRACGCRRLFTVSTMAWKGEGQSEKGLLENLKHHRDLWHMLGFLRHTHELHGQDSISFPHPSGQPAMELSIIYPLRYWKYWVYSKGRLGIAFFCFCDQQLWAWSKKELRVGMGRWGNCWGTMQENKFQHSSVKQVAATCITRIQELGLGHPI